MIAGVDVALVRADNPGPLTLTGTNTWLLGRDPCWVVDPGPLLEAHLDAVLAEAERRGGIGGIAPTPPHPHHARPPPQRVAPPGRARLARAAHPPAPPRAAP